MSSTDDNDSGLVEYVDPSTRADPVVYMSGRFEYSRKYDRAVRAFDTSMGKVVVGMWLGGQSKTEQQDAVFLAEDKDRNLWMAVADGLGGHPGGAEASQICCDVLEGAVKRGHIEINDAFANLVRAVMVRDELIMSNPRKPGGACIAIVCVDVANHRLHAWSMGDVEVCVQNWDADVLLSNPLDTGAEFHQVSKVLSPRAKYEFSYTETILNRGERILLHSDGFSNKAYRAFGDKNRPIDEQVRAAIKISESEHGPNADNLSLICLERFLPDHEPEGIYGLKILD